MNYGLYLSAAGVMASSYRQDAIANNLANTETVGFKRDLPLFHERLTAAQEMRDKSRFSNPMLDRIGGGIFASPTGIDFDQGSLENTGTPLDLAIEGTGYFAVSDKGQLKLTRDGRMKLNGQGTLVMANEFEQPVLDANQRPIQLDSSRTTTIAEDGTIAQDGIPVARLATYDVPDPTKLTKQGTGFYGYPNLENSIQLSRSKMHSGFVERANVDPATELSALMEAQRQLEANANMIRTQDQMLGRLVNEVGKIG